MGRRLHIPGLALFKRFRRSESGAVLVEFAVTMPLMILFFAVIVESARTFWNYQMVISGVRDASRYLSRVAPGSICSDGGNLSGYTTAITNIVSDDINGQNLFPAKVTINSVTPALTCVNGSYRNSPAPIASVTANVSIQFPLGFIFDWFGDELGTVTTQVADQSRIFGQ